MADKDLSALLAELIKAHDASTLPTRPTTASNVATLTFVLAL